MCVCLQSTSDIAFELSTSSEGSDLDDVIGVASGNIPVTRLSSMDSAAATGAASGSDSAVLSPFDDEFPDFKPDDVDSTEDPFEVPTPSACPPLPHTHSWPRSLCV